MKLTTTFTALVLSISALTGITSAETAPSLTSVEPTSTTLEASSAAVNSVLWQDWRDCYGIWYRTYEEYNYCGHLIRRWTVRL